MIEAVSKALECTSWFVVRITPLEAAVLSVCESREIPHNHA